MLDTTALTDDDFESLLDRERDDRFLHLVAQMQIGADAIREKRRLQDELHKMTEDRDKWEKVAYEGSGAMSSMLGDLVMGLSSGVLKIDRDVPLPERLKEKTE